MERDAGDSPLGRFRRVVFPVADDRVADGGKLHADLVLQSRDQFHPNQRSVAQRALHLVAKFGAGGLLVALGAQLLKHALLVKVVYESAFPIFQTSANYGAILPDRSMAEKLADKCVAICFVFAKRMMPDVKRSMRWTT